ncbi:MAG: SseB family protein [Actinomycetaceae bacterium]|nr:SseB family protein [Actinomycetaceae bacterium]MDY6083141.1 SseB family protein [Actinomycetaceae bacterium]
MRRLTPNPFASDTGAVPDELAAAFAIEDPIQRYRGVVHALAHVRVLAGIKAHPRPRDLTHIEENETLEIPELALSGSWKGNSAYPVFSSLDALMHFNSKLRPMPIAARDLARSAAERGKGLIVDPLPLHESQMVNTEPIADSFAGGHVPERPYASGYVIPTGLLRALADDHDATLLIDRADIRTLLADTADGAGARVRMHMDDDGLTRIFVGVERGFGRDRTSQLLTELSRVLSSHGFGDFVQLVPVVM